jgi:hypothetical protein
MDTKGAWFDCRPKADETQRLLEAAPDLLEACKQIVWKLNHNYALPDYKGPARITRQDATVKMAIAAIAKAEGREGNETK